ncbi:MAG: type III-B CRISPR module RAMP protein Cmr4 [Elusimicrobiales bacterium]|nr:type III-B CRISPR module RAMP protein Cmr4 [Elusimicrobiales bacterium]
MTSKILKIRALTQIHPGAGTGIGVVDMPVQREKASGYPVIQGSSIKGVLRSVYKGNYKDEIFGPESDGDDMNKYSSAASFSDGFIFAYPVRSLKGTFAWVSCPEVFRRINNIKKIVGDKDIFDLTNIKLSQQEIICANDITVNNNNSNIVVLEEYDFKKKDNLDINKIIEFGKSFFSDNNDKGAFEKRFAIINDEDFAHFVRYSTEVITRIALEKDRKITKKGALFYEEFLPAETLFYSIITFDDSRKSQSNIKAEDMDKDLTNNINNIIQLGGDETIGKGFCEINLN